MTFNVRGGLGLDGRRDTARIAEVVRDAAADIVCLQEVHQRLPGSGWVNQPGQWERVLGMAVVFQRNVNTGIGGYGLATASRLPLTEVTRRFLPSVGERRGALGVTVETADGFVRVWNTHWGLRQEERTRQAASLARWVNERDVPAIVCGDFNERPAAPAVRRLLDEAGLEDAGAGDEVPTYPADVPTARIDFLLHSAGLRRGCYTVVDTQASDHRPLVCDLTRRWSGEETPTSLPSEQGRDMKRHSSP